MRQNSSFGRQNADSLPTVVSKYEKDGVDDQNLFFSQVDEDVREDSENEAAASEMHRLHRLHHRLRSRPPRHPLYD